MIVTKPQGISVLSKLGFSEEEIVIYNTLIGQPEYVSIRRIAELTKINRGTVHVLLKGLVSKGLVSFNKSGSRKQYFAERPDRILDLVERKKNELSQLETAAKSLVPRLQTVLKRYEGQPQVRFFEYDEGISNILHDILKTVSMLETKEYYVISHRDLRPYLYRQFPGFTRQRIKLGIRVKVIKVGPGEATTGLDEVRHLDDKEAVLAKSYQVVYGNKVAMISVSADETPYGVIIEEEGVAKMHGIVFKKLWKTL